MKRTLVVVVTVAVVAVVALVLLSSGNQPPDGEPPSDSTPSEIPSETPSPNPPLNVRIDYIGVKNAMGDDDYEVDPLYGEIQLVIVITDGKSEPQTCYIPQSLEGFSIPDFHKTKINRRIYHTASAGDYLKLSMIAYDVDSKTKLMTDAAILELLGTIAGVPGTRIFKELVSLLPVEDDLVGEYEAAWYPDENYGIGQHDVSCLDKSANKNFFVGFSIWSDKEPPLLSVPSTLPDVPENQTLEWTMPPNTLTGSYVEYRRALQAGEKVTGSLQLTGYYPSLDWDSTCCFWVYDPNGNEVYKWCEDFKEDGLSHKFSFTASYNGVYVIKVEHCSFYSRQLHIEVSPYGWQ